MNAQIAGSSRHGVNARPLLGRSGFHVASWRAWLSSLCALRIWAGLTLLAIGVPAAGGDWGLSVRDAAGGGAEIVSVFPGSPAMAAGLRPGDIVIRAEVYAVRNAADFYNILQMVGLKSTLVLRISREGWERQLSLSANAAQAGSAPPAMAPPPTPSLGIQVADVPDGRGALITDVSPNGPAAQAGLRMGDAITEFEGRRIPGAPDFVQLLGGWAVGRPARLTVVRDGWAKEVTLVPIAAGQWSPQPMAPASPVATPAAPTPEMRGGPPPSPPTVRPESLRPIPPTAAPAEPGKAAVAVGDFQVKAANAAQFIGDGLREMLLTSLLNNGRVIVLERMDIMGLAAEQALSRSRMARPGEAIPEGRMDAAEILVNGAVTEFEAEAKGSGMEIAIPKLPLSLGSQTKSAHMAIDVRVIAVATGRVLFAQRIVGEAAAGQTTLGATVSAGGTKIPTSLGSYHNTPMEAAIRDCIAKATDSVVNNIPKEYFRHY
jgi:curli biogenesis system outer membrane secretion channel CsgG